MKKYFWRMVVRVVLDCCADLFDGFGYFFAFFCEFEDFEASFFLEADEVGFLHFVEDFDDVAVGAVDFFGEV